MKPSDAELKELQARYIGFDDTQDSYGLELTAAEVEVLGKLVGDEIARRAELSRTGSVPAELVGKYRYSNGVICNGTLRIACADFDTPPTDEVRDAVLSELCERANRAAAYGAAQKWISVAERLPDDFERVLMFLPDRIEPLAVGFWLHREDGLFISIGGTCAAIKHFQSLPTHWMPLPAPPATGE